MPPSRPAVALALLVSISCGRAAPPLQAAPRRELQARVGPDRRLLDTLGVVLERAVRDSAFPGAFVVVGNHAGVIAQLGAGHLDWSPSPVPDEHTLWDLASLT